ncbi:CDP-glucose 4,6-dehydratase [Alkalispirochaeta sphaeroplastigenens]|uniref:CDP-glucose 4,6-dehydratase n=1 Tax=Alkalispirochaeta sphaeroplastigenens TaxID=1187066 RepID=A0A2S4JHK6_9SPIO|nr:CDP-glucose 4,6-dehydratase [Alkalispirochaeta sphaeroplastigenens]
MGAFGDVFRGARVLVTGNTGFKGAWLTAWLLRLGADVYGLSKDIPTVPSAFAAMGLEGRVRQHWLDVRDAEGVSATVAEVRPDALFHLAAQPVVSRSYDDPLETLSTNALGTANVLESLRRLNKFCAAVMITSDKCYHNEEWTWGYRENDRLGGTDIYSASKACAETIIAAYFHSFLKSRPNLRIASARAGNVIGGGDWTERRIVPDCFRAWSEGKRVSLRSPKSTRPWQHVLEPLSGYLALVANLISSPELNGESFNFGPRAEQNVTVEEVVRDLGIRAGFDDPARAFSGVADAPFAEAGLLKLNCDKALSALGWRAAMTYTEMIAFTGEWYARFLSGGEGAMRDFTMEQIEAYERTAGKEGVAWAL